MDSLRHPCTSLFLVPTLLVLLAADAAAGETVNLRLDSVQIQRQRERGGDRPYFATLKFRSRLNTRGSTEVWIVEFEPHDWVSKQQYRGGLPRGDHLQAGQRTAIPWWMGEHQWRDVDIVNGRGATADVLREATTAELLGAIIFSFDNNNTPPHVIRELLGKARQIVHRLLVAQVESGRILGSVVTGDTARLQRVLTAQAERFARQVISGFDVARLLFQLTVGSTFNPDQPTGVHVILLPAVTGLTAIDQTVALPGLPGGPVTARLLIASPVDRREEWTFAGSGARYLVRALIDRDTSPGSTPVPQLLVRLRTGNDDLRSGSRVTAEAILRDGRRVQGNIMSGPVAPRNSSGVGRINLPAGTVLDHIRTVRIRFHADGGGAFKSSDDWDLDAVQVRYGTSNSGRLVMDAGATRALKHFTQRRNTWEVHFEERGSPRLTVPPIRVSPVPVKPIRRRR